MKQILIIHLNDDSNSETVTFLGQEIEILRGPARQPQLQLSGGAAALAEDLGLDTWSLSLTHNQSQAIALVVAIGEP